MSILISIDLAKGTHNYADRLLTLERSAEVVFTFTSETKPISLQLTSSQLPAVNAEFTADPVVPKQWNAKVTPDQLSAWYSIAEWTVEVVLAPSVDDVAENYRAAHENAKPLSFAKLHVDGMDRKSALGGATAFAGMLGLSASAPVWFYAAGWSPWMHMVGAVFAVVFLCAMVYRVLASRRLALAKNALAVLVLAVLVGGFGNFLVYVYSLTIKVNVYDPQIQAIFGSYDSVRTWSPFELLKYQPLLNGASAHIVEEPDSSPCYSGREYERYFTRRNVRQRPPAILECNNRWALLDPDVQRELGIPVPPDSPQPRCVDLTGGYCTRRGPALDQHRVGLEVDMDRFQPEVRAELLPTPNIASVFEAAQRSHVRTIHGHFWTRLEVQSLRSEGDVIVQWNTVGRQPHTPFYMTELTGRILSLWRTPTFTVTLQNVPPFTVSCPSLESTELDVYSVVTQQIPQFVLTGAHSEVNQGDRTIVAVCAEPNDRRTLSLTVRTAEGNPASPAGPDFSPVHELVLSRRIAAVDLRVQSTGSALARRIGTTECASEPTSHRLRVVSLAALGGRPFATLTGQPDQASTTAFRPAPGETPTVGVFCVPRVIGGEGDLRVWIDNDETHSWLVARRAESASGQPAYELVPMP